MKLGNILAWFKDWRHTVIIGLALAVAVETVLLITAAPPTLTSPDLQPQVVSTQPAAAKAVVDPRGLRDIHVTFTTPIGKGRVGLPLGGQIATLSPDVQGTWEFSSPFTLHFQADERLASASTYDLTLHPEALLTEGQSLDGTLSFRLQTGGFVVKRIRMDLHPVKGDPKKTIIGGSLTFSTPVSAKDLAQHLTLIDPDGDPVELTLQSSGLRRTFSFLSSPVTKHETPRELTLTVSGALTPAGGNIPLGQEITSTISPVLATDLTIRDVTTVNRGDHFDIQVFLSSPVLAERAGQFVHVSPTMDIDVAADGTRLLLRGRFLPGKNYEVRLAKGLTAADGSSLKDNFVRTVTMNDLEPTVRFASEGMFLTSQGARSLVLESVNVSKARLYVDRVYRNNLFQLFTDHGWDVFDPDFYQYDQINHSMGDRLLETDLEIERESNTFVTTPLELGGQFDKDEPGLYRVAAVLDGEWSGPERWVMITDLGLVVKRGQDGLMVWCVGFSDLAPKAEVKISVLSDQNQPVAGGKTDANGLWSSGDLGSDLEKNRPYLITAELGEDFSFLLLDRFKADTTGLDVAGKKMPRQGYLAFLYGERDIYRPGETLKGAIMVRDQVLGTPPPLPVTLLMSDPQGRDLTSRVLRTDNAGMAEFSFDVPAHALTGKYRLTALVAEKSVGEYRYQIEEFVPDRIKVQVLTDKAAVHAGDPLDFTVKSDYLFGAPAAGLDVEARVLLMPRAFAPKGYEYYVFGDPEREFAPNELWADEEGKLDDNGTRAYTVDLPGDLTPPAGLEARVTARVMEQGGRGVSFAQGIILHPYPYYLGMKSLDRKNINPGDEVTFDFVAVKPDGQLAQPGEISATVYKDEWHTVVRQTGNGGYRYESKRQARQVYHEVLVNQAEGSFSFTPRTWGSYRAVIKDMTTEAVAQAEFYSGGWGYSPWALENPARIEIVPDKKEYKSGETASFQIRAPFAGKLLVTVEGTKVHDTRVVTLTGNTGQIELPMKAAYAPNVYLTAVLVRSAFDLNPDEVNRAYGAVPVFVNRERARIDVAVEAEEDIRPNTKLTITAKTEPGATVTLAAVDEGILQLIAQETPDPFDFFYAKRMLEVLSADTFAMLFPELAKIVGAGSPGGGEDLEKMSQFVRTESITRVKPVAFWSGLLKADANGVVRHEIEVPDFMGALRIMAVAADATRFGAGSATTRIKSPISVTPTFPRFLAQDETVHVPVTVRNDTEEPGRIKVGMEYTGPVRVEKPVQFVDLQAGRDATIHFTIYTGQQEGAAAFKITTEGMDETATASVDIGVRAGLPMQRMASAGTLKAGTTDFPVAPPTLLPGSVKRDLTIGRLPTIRFAGNLKQLLGYPHGCVEQTTSKAFPLIYFGDLASELAPDLLGSTSPEAMVQTAVTRLRTMQLPSGLFAMWPGGEKPHYWGSIYATHFLVEAQRAGHQVNEAMLNPALKGLADITREMKPAKQNDMELLTYALYVLARADRAETGTMNFVRQQHFKLLDGRTAALLAGAFASAGDMETFEEIMVKAPNVPDRPRARGGNLGSGLRDQAMTLLALMQANPSDPRIPKLVEKITSGMEAGRWYTTQENAFAFMAMGAFFRAQSDAPPFSGTVLLDGKAVGDFDSASTFRLKDIPAGSQVSVSMKEGYQADTAYFSMGTRGTPTLAAYQPRSQLLEVQRRFLDRNGHTMNVAVLNPGDLVVMEINVRSLAGRVENLVIQNLLPPGLEIENQRLASTDILPWMNKKQLPGAYIDPRDDRVLVFTDILGRGQETREWHSTYSLLRVVTPGEFLLPPVQAEAMYDPEIVASGPIQAIRVEKKK